MGRRDVFSAAHTFVTGLEDLTMVDQHVLDFFADSELQLLSPFALTLSLTIRAFQTKAHRPTVGRGRDVPPSLMALVSRMSDA